MDWICYIFKHSNHLYMVPEDNEIDACKSLAKRQSMSVENCKKQYKLIDRVTARSGIIKI